MKEIWVYIKGYKGLYEVSNLGRVRNIVTGKFLKGRINLSGYRQVCFCKDGKKKWFLIHRLVGEEFVPNLFGDNEIDHIDGNRLNNRSDNLRWVSSSENKRNIPKSVRRKKKGKVRKINQYTLDGGFVRQWPSASAVQRETGFCSLCILWCCQGKSKTSHGYLWRYKDEND